MSGGFYPFSRTFSPTGKRLAQIADDLRKLLDTRGEDFTRDAMPAAWQNDQTDNAAQDGGYEGGLYLALELIERCVEPTSEPSKR
jgi:hypothetical protein